jgi:hypothetical protein
MLLTGSFFTVPRAHAGRVSIARSAPSGHRQPSYRAFAPGFSGWNSLPYDRYKSLYFQQLAQIDIRQALEDVQSLVPEGVTPIVMCWERTGVGDDWCHRRMLAEWIEDETGLYVPEFDASAHGHLIQTAQIDLFKPKVHDPSDRVGLIEACKITGLPAREIMELRFQGKLDHGSGGYLVRSLFQFKRE